MEEVVIVLHLIAVIALIVIVLIQKSEGGALGIGGGGGMGGLFSSRGAANLLTRSTAILAVVFFSTSLTLAIFAQKTDSPASILDTPVVSEGDRPSLPGDAGTGGGKGILDELKRQSPAPATGPQVPNSQ